MPAKIEIYENTLLKLLVRRGANIDRQNVVLAEGELGYATDTKRLFIGDGQTLGGVNTGATFLGTATSITSFLAATKGDYAYDSIKNILYVYNGGGASDINNWQAIGGVYTPGNTTVTVTSANIIAVGKLSAGNVSSNLLGSSLVLDTSNKIALSSTVAVDSIIPYSGTPLNLPKALTINNVNYQWPGTGGIAANYVLTTDVAGNLSWAPSINTNTIFVSGTASQIPVGSLMPWVSASSAPQGWLLCNGQLVAGSAFPELSAVIGTTYGGSGGNFNVPNLINKTIYGVSGIGTGGNPATSTLFNISSGTNSPLSATGMLYIMKAKPDNVINSSLTVTNGLTSFLNGNDTTGSPFNPLSGNVQIGLQKLLSAQNINGSQTFSVDSYGRVTGTVSEIAGTSTVIPYSGTQVIPPTAYNSLSPISFLRTPLTFFANDESTSTVMSISAATISAFPLVTILPGGTSSPPLPAPTAGVPAYAKNIIIESDVYKEGPDSGLYTERYILAALNTSLLQSNNIGVVGSNEYIVSSSRALHAGGRYTSQVIIPLSATASGALTCAFRISPSYYDSIKLRIVGYTL